MEEHSFYFHPDPIKAVPKDIVAFEGYAYEEEGRYLSFYGGGRLLTWFYQLAEKGWWVSLVAIMHLMNMWRIGMELKTRATFFDVPYDQLLKTTYNILFFIHVHCDVYNDFVKIRRKEMKFRIYRVVWYILDLATFGHYFKERIPGITHNNKRDISICVTTFRILRTLKFLRGLNKYFLNLSITSSILKYLYYFFVMRVIYTFVIVRAGYVKVKKYTNEPYWLQKEDAIIFYSGFFEIHKIFLQVSTQLSVKTTYSRIVVIVVIMSGCVAFLGITINAMAHVVACHIRRGEVYRLRYKMIIRMFHRMRIDKLLRDKIIAFYHMYWHKQKAVSSSQLMKQFPPTIRSDIIVDIYFEGLQKSRVLRDLSFQFLSEIAKVMETVNYVPGDILIKRKSMKSSMFFIRFGEVEVVTAEDDLTPILRFTRGSIINPCGICLPVGATHSHVSVRAATFCTAHVLRCTDLWRICARIGRINGQSYILLASFEEHFENVKKHYLTRPKKTVKHKSSIVQLKRNLIALKNTMAEDGKPVLGRIEKFLEISGCYVMRNRPNAALTVDMDLICLKPTFPFILQPQSSLLRAWKWSILIFTLVIGILYPYQMVYLNTVPREFKYFDASLTLIYILDIFVNLSIGDKIEEGVPLTFTKTASEQLKDPWIVIDILAAVPLMEITPYTKFRGANKIFKLPKVFKFLKELEDVYIFKRNILRYTEYGLTMVFIVWLLATVNQAFYCFVGKRCDVTNYTDYIFWHHAELNDGPTDNRILISIYWALNVVTFSDVRSTADAPFSWIIQIPSMFILEITTIYRIFMASFYAATIIVTETLSDDFNNWMTTVKYFLDKNNIKEVLSSRLNQYFKLCWQYNKAFSITNERGGMLYDLPKHVSKEFFAEQTKHYLSFLPFWKYLTFKEKLELAGSIRHYYCGQNEILLSTGDTANEMYVIRHGYCKIYDPVYKRPLRTISARGYFGVIETILRLPVHYSVQATTDVMLYCLSLKNLKRVLIKPQFVDLINYCRSLPEYKSVLRRRERFIHYVPPPPIPNRMIFPLLRKHEADIAFQQPFQRLGFFAVFRYVFPRFTLHPCGSYLRNYEWFRCAFSIVYAILSPIYEWVILDIPRVYYLRLFLDLTCFYDIMQHMLVGYFTEDGILIYHPASTAAHYIKSAFVVDFLAMAPFEHLDEMRTRSVWVNGKFKQPNLYQFLRLNRLLLLYRSVRTLDTLQLYIKRRDILLVIKAMPLFLGIVSLTVSLIASDSARRMVSPKHAHGAKNYELSVTEHITEHGHWAVSFNNVALRYNITATSSNFILTLYYWAIDELTTTIYRAFQPTSRKLVLYLIANISLVEFMLTFIAMRIISIRANVNKSLARFQNNLKDIKKYMTRERFSLDLQREVTSFFEHIWEKMGARTDRQILKVCDHIMLRTDLILEMYGPAFMMNPIFRRCEQALLRILGRAVYNSHFKEGSTIIEHEDVIKTMFLVEHGYVEVYEIIADDHIRLFAKLPPGSIFGHLERKKVSVCQTRFVAGSNVHLLEINTDVFYKIIRDFPRVGELLVKYRPNNENYITGTGSLATKSDKQNEKVDTRAITTAITSAVSQVKYLKYLNIHSKFMQIYVIIVSFSSIFANVYNAAFVRSDFDALFVLYFLDGLFLMKIVLNYITTMLFEGEKELSSVTVRKGRKTRELKYDIISCIPIEICAFLSQTYTWQIFALLRLNRMLRMITLKTSLKSYREQLSINLTINTVVNLLVWFSLSIHIVACLYYSLHAYEDSLSPGDTWLYGLGEQAHVKKCDGHEYLCSTYFILSSFVHNGPSDLRPTTRIEVLFTCIFMVMSSMIFMIYVGEFSNVLQFQNFRVIEYYSKILESQVYLKNNHVSKTLIDQFQEYAVYLWREQRGLQLPTFIQTAPKSIRDKIMSTAYLPSLMAHSLFCDCEPAFLRQLCGYFRVYSFMKGMYVLRESAVTDAMYFVHKGAVKQIYEEEDMNVEEELQEFNAGHNFGTVNGLLRNIPFQHTYLVVSKAIILTLYLPDWESLLEQFPISYGILYNELDENLDYDVGVKQLKKHNRFMKAAKSLFKDASKEASLKQSAEKVEKVISKMARKSIRKSIFGGIGQKKEKEVTPAPANFIGIPSGRESGDSLIVPTRSVDTSKINIPSFGKKKESSILRINAPPRETSRVKLSLGIPRKSSDTSKQQISIPVVEKKKETPLKEVSIQELPTPSQETSKEKEKVSAASDYKRRQSRVRDIKPPLRKEWKPKTDELLIRDATKREEPSGPLVVETKASLLELKKVPSSKLGAEMTGIHVDSKTSAAEAEIMSFDYTTTDKAVKKDHIKVDVTAEITTSPPPPEKRIRRSRASEADSSGESAPASREESRQGSEASVMSVDIIHPLKDQSQSRSFLDRVKSQLSTQRSQVEIMERMGKDTLMLHEDEARTKKLLRSLESGINLIAEAAQRGKRQSIVASDVMSKVMDKKTKTLIGDELKKSASVRDLGRKEASVRDQTKREPSTREIFKTDSSLSEVTKQESATEETKVFISPETAEVMKKMAESLAGGGGFSSDVSLLSGTSSMYSVEGYMMKESGVDKTEISADADERMSDVSQISQTSILMSNKSSMSMDSLTEIRRPEKKKALVWKEEETATSARSGPSWMLDPMHFDMLDEKFLDDSKGSPEQDSSSSKKHK